MIRGSQQAARSSLVEPRVGFRLWLHLTQRKRNTLLTIKSAVIPQVRVEPELRAELESVLQQGETLSGFVETSVRNAAAFRRMQTRFHQRRQAAWEHYQSTGAAVPAEEVLAKLQTMLEARRKQLGE